ncbi:MAG TPA: hypothetical protein PKK68_10850, partial [Methanothrix soehngenii]|nr:hypothetical protein [Methanothrix soehngenii]
TSFLAGILSDSISSFGFRDPHHEIMIANSFIALFSEGKSQPVATKKRTSSMNNSSVRLSKILS